MRFLTEEALFAFLFGELKLKWDTQKVSTLSDGLLKHLPMDGPKWPRCPSMVWGPYYGLAELISRNNVIRKYIWCNLKTLFTRMQLLGDAIASTKWSVCEKISWINQELIKSRPHCTPKLRASKIFPPEIKHLQFFSLAPNIWWNQVLLTILIILLNIE